ncbi:MAG: hypothetical protein RI965_701 [Bacteroidota bacterium]|jgi:hypothetical protein
MKSIKFYLLQNTIDTDKFKINPCKLNPYKGFLFRVHRKVHSFLGFLKSSRLTYPYYKISEEREKVKGVIYHSNQFQIRTLLLLKQGE